MSENSLPIKLNAGDSGLKSRSSFTEAMLLGNSRKTGKKKSSLIDD